MSDPQPARLKKTPRRAEPLQPDQPGRGDETDNESTEESESSGQSRSSEKAAKDLQQQSETALKNVSEGYK
jgi:hypothetical protein